MAKKDPKQLDFVFGVVKQYDPETSEEVQELMRIQAAIKGEKWLSWFSNVSKEPARANFADEDLDYSSVEKYEALLQRFHGMQCSEDCVLEEFSALSEFSLHAESAYSLTLWWNFFYVCLERAFEQFLNSGPINCQPSIEACLSLVEVILERESYARKNAAALFDSFVRICCTACRLLLLQRDTEKAFFLSTLLARLDNEKLSTSDLVYLTASCCSFLQLEDALRYLKKAHYPDEPHTVTCFKICLLHDTGQYDKALELATLLSEDTIYKYLTPKLKSQLCDIMGSCLYNTGLPYVSVDWFCKSLNEDPTNTMSLWHMANAYRKLDNVGAERAALRVMAQVSSGLSASHSSVLPISMPLSSQAEPTEALYILASRLQSAGLHEEATEHFASLLLNWSYSQTSEWIFVPKPKLVQIYIQAAQTHLHAGQLQECIRILKSVLVDCLDTRLEARPGLFKTIVAQLCERSIDHLNVQTTSCFAYLLHAVAEMNLVQGNNEEAENILKRILGSVSLLDSDGNVLEQNICKLKNQVGKESGSLEIFRHWLEMVSQVYCNLSVLRIRRGLMTDALHLLKLSLMAWPDNLDSLYNYVLLLLQMDKVRKATQVWNTAVDRNLGQLLSLNSIVQYWNFNVTIDQLKEMNKVLT